MKTILDNLNQSQKEAVEYIDGALLILAGAGTGKTKTLTTRLAYLIDVVGIDPKNTLTLTFTNKSAKEMRNRALNLINQDVIYPPLLCTFHKFGLIFLKFNIDKLKRENDFVIIDTSDKKNLLKNIIKDLRLDIPISFVANEISKYKNSIITPNDAIKNAELIEYKNVAKIYKIYQDEIIEKNLVDFDDLLMLTYQILNENPSLRANISRKYRYIMVDEYQDTNELQLQILKLLTSEHNNLCVVGDDDQSIYKFRGANIKNIVEFDKIFKDVKIVKLETNYRSSNQIVEVANTLIEHNRYRVGKNLTSNRGERVEVRLNHCIDEAHESRFIAIEIKKLIQSGVSSDNIAVLYRINSLSRSLEDGFNKEKLDYKLLAGVRFYERAEIKDVISYLRVIFNHNDDFSLLRIINKPKRGIGKVSLDKLQRFALNSNQSIFEYIKDSHTDILLQNFNKKIVENLKEFVSDIEELKRVSINNLYTLTDKLEEIINIKECYNKLMDTDNKIDNIDEFYGYFKDTIRKSLDIDLEKFLDNISLSSEQDKTNNGSITIMTIHASKGLEFDYIYVIGLEEEFFPLLREDIDIEEERRLCYVAITRAKTYLTLSYVDSRFYKGHRQYMKKSRFLGESGVIKDTSLKVTTTSKYKKGDIVKHKIFGMGRVQSVLNKIGKDYKLRINFGSQKRDILSRFVEPIQ